MSIGCTTLEMSGAAVLEVHNVHFGRPLSWQDSSEIGEATIAGTARLTGREVSIRNVRFHTKDNGKVVLEKVVERGTIERRSEGGTIEIRGE